MKPNTLTEREKTIIDSADSYSVVVRRAPRQTFSNRATAIAAACQTQGAVVYAAGTVDGLETSALFGTFTPEKGWREIPA